VSTLRARCPECRTLTAVALAGGEYECHSCGRSFRAALVRVPRAWGSDGEPMAEAAFLELPYPEAGVVEEDALSEQHLAIACSLPERPLIVGGCCCSHVGAVEGLAARHDRLGVIWLDAHGDLNTPETSPSGNAWGMPLRMILDGGAADAHDVALIGSRNLDPPEVEFIASAGIHDDVQPVLDTVDCVYVALDCDVFEPNAVRSFMPEPGGLSLEEVEELFHAIAERAPVVGAGLSGLAAEPSNVEPLTRLLTALRL
jgi:arginase